MLPNCVLTIQGNIVHANDHPNRLLIYEIGLVGLNDAQILWVASHRLERLQPMHPELRSPVVLEDLRRAFDSS